MHGRRRKQSVLFAPDAAAPRARPHRPPQRRKGKLPLGPLMIGFFIFVVVGSSARRRRRRHTQSAAARRSRAAASCPPAGMFDDPVARQGQVDLLEAERRR